MHAERRMHHQHHRRPAQIGHVGEIAQPVIGRVAAEGGRDHVGCYPGDHERIAVGLRQRDLVRADHAAGADAVLDIELLMQLLAQMLGGDAAERVGGAAGRERRDELDRPGRPGLGMAALGRAQKAESRQGEQQQTFLDHFSIRRLAAAQPRGQNCATPRHHHRRAGQFCPPHDETFIPRLAGTSARPPGRRGRRSCRP